MARGPMGCGHIPQKYAQPINAFYQAVFNPWLNLHRPCPFASTPVRAKGMVIKRCRHRDAKTPPVRTTALRDAGLDRLKPGVTLAALQARADAQTDLAAAPAMHCAKAELFERFKQRRPHSVQRA